MSVKTFVKNSKLLYNNAPKCTVILGNQSADLDSVVSAISLAYYFTCKSAQQRVYIPIINSTPLIQGTKKEFILMLDYLSLGLEDFIYVADWKKCTIEGAMLVDHNELDAGEKSLINDETFVTSVIDHHLDNRLFLNTQPRIVDTRVGSCISLIVDLIKQSAISLDSSFADMMLVPILSDTCNLTLRTHQIDLDAVAYLRQFSSLEQLEPLYARLQQAKFTFDPNENVQTLLAKDYKACDDQWAVSAVTFSLVEWANETHMDDLFKFKRDRSLRFYGCLSFFQSGANEFKRDLILLGDSDLLSEFLQLNVENLTLAENNLSKEYLIFNVENAALTRKHWQPLLAQFLKQSKHF